MSTVGEQAGWEETPLCVGRRESIGGVNMKERLIDLPGIKTLGLALGLAVVMGVAGCATGRTGGTAALDESSRVQGRDLGRGGATSGGLSSVDPSGNAADYSVYDARRLQQQQQQQ